MSEDRRRRIVDSAARRLAHDMSVQRNKLAQILTCSTPAPSCPAPSLPGARRRLDLKARCQGKNVAVLPGVRTPDRSLADALNIARIDHVQSPADVSTGHYAVAVVSAEAKETLDAYTRRNRGELDTVVVETSPGRPGSVRWISGRDWQL